MNRETAPTDWKGAVMQKRIAGRYAAERRFKLFGLGAVLLSGAFLAFLLFVMVGNGARGFTYTSVAVPVDFVGMPLTIDTARLRDADAGQVIANAGLADIVAFARSEEHKSELQSLMRTSYAVFCLKKKKNQHYKTK